MTNKKEILFKCWFIISICNWIKMTISALQGKTGSMETYIVLLANSIIILYIITKIIRKIYDNKHYREYIRGIKYLESVHKMRYELYFKGDKSKIREYSAEIDIYLKSMLYLFNYYVDKKKYGEKRTKRIKEILEKTESIMTTEQPLN